MKKIALLALCASLMSVAQAEENEATVSETQEVLDNAKASFSGVYFGGGVHVMNMQDELKYEDAQAAARSNKLEDSTKGRLGGTIVLGIGKKFDAIPFYLALEGMLDFAPNTTIRGADKSDSIDTNNYGQYSVTMKRNGLVPSVGVRFAWASDYLQALAYLKVAASFTKDRARFSYFAMKIRGTDVNRKYTTEVQNSKVQPEVTLGFEKRFGKIGMRMEGGYAFGMGEKEIGAAPFADNGDKLKFKKKGTVVLRMMAVMNMNLFK